MRLFIIIIILLTTAILFFIKDSRLAIKDKEEVDANYIPKHYKTHKNMCEIEYDNIAQQYIVRNCPYSQFAT